MHRGILIGISGGSASGKTLVASRIHEALGTRRVLILKQDSYYRDLTHLSEAERAAQNFDHPDAFDSALLIQQLTILLEGGYVEEPIYDFTHHRRIGQTHRIGGAPVIVLEGILILSDPALRELMDIKIYVDTDPDIRLLRRLRRDVEERGRTVTSVLNQYEQFVRPMHLQFVEPSKRYADVVIPEGGYNRVAIDLLKTKIASVLAEKWPEPWRPPEEGPEEQRPEKERPEHAG
jgi:uridine kinase